MTAFTYQPQTFARTITVCGQCGKEVQGMYASVGQPTTIQTCGHVATMIIKRNPLLPPE